MRAYVTTSGAIFGLLVLAHALRVMAEGTHLMRDPWFVLATIAPAGLCLWAFSVLRRPAAR